MNQYIITDEDIWALTDYVLGAFYEGENKEKTYDLIKAQISAIRSHPYDPQAEREKLLDELETFINAMQFNYGLLSNPYLNGIKKEMEKLRQEGKVEK